MGKKLKIALAGLASTAMVWLSFLSAWASFFTDYSATGSGSDAKTQIAESVWETGQTLGSMIYTIYKIGIGILQNNAVLFIVITMFVALISFIALRRRMKRMGNVKM